MIAIDFHSPCTVPPAVPSIFYSNCVCSILCLSYWTIISRKANTIYLQNSEHDCSLNIWGLSGIACLWLSRSSDARYSVWVLWTDGRQCSPEPRGWQAHRKFSEIGRNWVLQHFSTTTVTTKLNQFNSVCKNLNAHLSDQFFKAAIRDEEPRFSRAYDTGIEVLQRQWTGPS